MLTGLGLGKAVLVALFTGFAVKNLPLEKWLREFVGWWEDNGPAMVDGILKVFGAIGKTLAEAIPVLLGAAGDVLAGVWDKIVANKEAILRKAGEIVSGILGAMRGLAEAIVPPLVEAAGKMIDWISQDVIPYVAGKVAGFIDSVVRALVPLGEDGGQLDEGMKKAGQQLIKWITDRIPGALAALLDYAISIENWIVSVLAPRLAAAMLGIGAAVLQGLWDGLVAAINNPGQFVADMAKLLYAILVGAAIIKVAISAGAIVGLAYTGSIALLRFTAGMIAGMATVLLQTLAGTAITAGAAAAGTSVAFAFASALALALPALLFALVSPQIQKWWRDNITHPPVGFENNNPFNPPDTTVVPGPGRPLTPQDVGITTPPIKVPIKLEFLGPPLPVIAPVIDLSERLQKFNEDTDSIVTTWNSLPGRLTSTADKIRDILSGGVKPKGARDRASLKALVKEFQSDYKLIAAAIKDGSVDGIVYSQALSAQMTEMARTTNEAYIKAGKSPPFLINSLTGAVTLTKAASKSLAGAVIKPVSAIPPVVAAAGAAATGLPVTVAAAVPATGVAGTSLANSLTAPFIPLPAFFDGVGTSCSSITTGIQGQIVPAGTAASLLAGAVTGPLTPAPGAILGVGTSIGIDYVAGVNAGLAGASVDPSAILYPLKTPPGEGTPSGWGAAIGGSWIQGVADAIRNFNLASVISGILRFLRGKSPPTEGPLKEIDVWGANIGAAWIDGIVAGLKTGPQRIASAIAEVGTSMNTALAGSAASLSLSPSMAYNPSMVPAYAMGPTPARTSATGLPKQTDPEQVRLLEAISAHLGLNNQLTAQMVDQNPVGTKPVTARGELARRQFLMPGGRL
jgi:hypothetical protein